MFSGGSARDKIEELKAESEKELASVPEVNIPNFNLDKIKMKSLDIKPPVSKKKKGFMMPNLNAYKRKELSKYSFAGDDIFQNKNANLFAISTVDNHCIFKKKKSE